MKMWIEDVDPFKSIVTDRNRSIDCNRFLAIFGDFSSKIKLDTGKRLDKTPHYCTPP